MSDTVPVDPTTRTNTGTMKFPRHWFKRRSIAPDLPPPHGSISPPVTPPILPPPQSTMPPPYDGTMMPTTMVEEKSADASVMILLREDYVSARSYFKELNYRTALKAAVRRHLYKWYAIIAAAIVLTVLLSVKHDEVVHFCRPIIDKIRKWPAGFMIPILLLVIVSFPPLVGHEIIGILVGLVWGLGPGFAILAAGTFIGEIATWIAFKWCCQARAQKFEAKNKLYASLTELIRAKSFMFVLVLRFSAVPGHITTAVSASAGANFWSYLAAAFLTLPKQFTIVYLGQAFGTKSRKNTIVSTVTTVLTMLGTVVAAVYIYYQMRLVMRRRAIITPLAIVPMSEAPTWADVAAAEEGEGRGVIILSPVPRDAKIDPKAVHDALARQRPWLYHDDSFSALASGSGSGSGSSLGRPKMRAWSVPHHMTDEEMREFMAEMESAQGTGGVATPAIVIDDEPPQFFDSFTDDKNASFSSLSSSRRWSPPRRAPSPGYTFGAGMGAGAGAGAGSSSGSALLAPDTTELLDDFEVDTSYPPSSPSALAPTSMSSGRIGRPRSDTQRSMSIDLGRPSRQVVSGRDVADEADRYAFDRGGRRPDYGRMRGESRAALLGRPKEDDDDATSSRSG